MANRGKFVDKNPEINAAGVVIEPSDAIGDSLKIYSNEEAAKYIIDKKCKIAKEKVIAKLPLHLPEGSVHELLTPEMKKSRFVAFREKFSEDMFFPKPELGKALQSNSIPSNLSNESKCYGKLSTKEEALYSIVLPKKSQEEVNREYIKWHDKYLISHKHYLPSEMVKRK